MGVFESLSAPLQVQDMYRQRHMYKAFVTGILKLDKNARIHLSLGPDQPKHTDDVHAVEFHVPALDRLFRGKHILQLNNWSIRQLCHNWNGPVPQGAIEVTALKARSMLQHENNLRQASGPTSNPCLPPPP